MSSVPPLVHTLLLQLFLLVCLPSPKRGGENLFKMCDNILFALCHTSGPPRSSNDSMAFDLIPFFKVQIFSGFSLVLKIGTLWAGGSVCRSGLIPINCKQKRKRK